MQTTASLRRGDDWSPYGHEKARRQLLMQRQAYILAGAVAVALLYGLFLELTLTRVTDTGTGGGTIDIVQQEQKPITVTVSPGRAPAFADAQAVPPSGAEAPLPWAEEKPFLIRTVGPFLPLVAPLLGALWLLLRAGASARGKLAELNFGVYKGAMPYEMHTVRALERVFTHRLVKRHVFGREATDFLAGTYLGPPPLVVRRLLGDLDVPDPAEVTRLARGRRSARRRAAPARPTWRPTVVAGTAEVRRLRPVEDTRGSRAVRLRESTYDLLDAGDRFIDRVADWLEPLARRAGRRHSSRAR